MKLHRRTPSVIEVTILIQKPVSIINGISAYNEGQRGWGLFGAIAGGAVMGGAEGAVLVLGGATGLTFVGAGVGWLVDSFGDVLIDWVVGWFD